MLLVADILVLGHKVILGAFVRAYPSKPPFDVFK